MFAFDPRPYLAAGFDTAQADPFLGEALSRLYPGVDPLRLGARQVREVYELAGGLAGDMTPYVSGSGQLTLPPHLSSFQEELVPARGVSLGDTFRRLAPLAILAFLAGGGRRG